MDQARRVPRFAEAAVERARLSVVPRAPVARAARLPFVSLVSLLLVAGVAGLLLFNTTMQQVSFTATSLERKAQALDAQRQSLQMELDRLRNPQRVALAARRMGMVPPASPAFLRLADGRVLGAAQPATAEDSFRITPQPSRKPKNLDPPPVFVTPSGERWHEPGTAAAPPAGGATSTGATSTGPTSTGAGASGAAPEARTAREGTKKPVTTTQANPR